jgi:hypothetical protein
MIRTDQQSCHARIYCQDLASQQYHTHKTPLHLLNPLTLVLKRNQHSCNTYIFNTMRIKRHHLTCSIPLLLYSSAISSLAIHTLSSQQHYTHQNTTSPAQWRAPCSDTPVQPAFLPYIHCQANNTHKTSPHLLNGVPLTLVLERNQQLLGIIQHSLHQVLLCPIRPVLCRLHTLRRQLPYPVGRT